MRMPAQLNHLPGKHTRVVALPTIGDDQHYGTAGPCPAGRESHELTERPTNARATRPIRHQGRGAFQRQVGVGVPQRGSAESAAYRTRTPPHVRGLPYPRAGAGRRGRTAPSTRRCRAARPLRAVSICGYAGSIRLGHRPSAYCVAAKRASRVGHHDDAAAAGGTTGVVD